jgi:TolB-like protein/Tfp pilus assembly protein PilF
VILFEMISGQLPFRGEREHAMFYSILNEDPEPITGLRSGVPMELERLIDKALAKNPDERYQSMEDILVDLKSLEKRNESGKSLTKSITAVKPRKNLTIIFAGIALIIVLRVFIGFLFTPNETKPINSIAVLPLENLSGDPEQDYFADGMTEAIITELSKIKALRVISRTSVMHYKKTEKTLPEIAKELNVKAVVEGSVLRAKERVRITSQLISLDPEQQLWANNYDRDLRDILTLSREVAQAISKEIKITLTPQEQARMTIARPVNPESHQLYLKGRFQVYKSTTKDVIDKSIEYFRQSLEKDPDYALAQVGLAEAYIQLAQTGYAPVKTEIPKAKTAALKALAIDSSLGEAYTQLATAKVYGEWDWLGGEKLFKRAIELSPGSAIAHLNYGFLLSYLGHHEEAIREGIIAQQLDPLAIWINVSVGRFYYYARQYDQTIVECNKVLELNPGAVFPQFMLALSYVQKGKYEQAIAEFLKRNVKSPGTNWALGYTYGVAGEKEKATEVLNFLLEKSKQTFIWSAIIAYVYIGLGDKDKAFEWLEKTYEQQEGWLEVLKVDPWFDTLRDDPRFHDLVKRMNFPE